MEDTYVRLINSIFFDLQLPPLAPNIVSCFSNVYYELLYQIHYTYFFQIHSQFCSIYTREVIRGQFLLYFFFILYLLKFWMYPYYLPFWIYITQCPVWWCDVPELCFYSVRLLASRQTTKQEKLSRLAVHDCLFGIFAVHLHIQRPIPHSQPECAICCGDRYTRLVKKQHTVRNVTKCHRLSF